MDAGTDAGVDAGTDAGVDAGTDAGVDAGTDAGTDAGVDAGTGGDPDGGGGGEPDAGPTLSETPLWQVDFDPAHTEGCFGRSIALGDVNGDGSDDLVVAAAPCLTTSRDPGRISFFVGQETFFSKQPVTGTLTWTNTNPRTSGRNLTVSTGNVNGDSYADVLASGAYGVSVFTGKAELDTVLAQPLFRVPGTGTFTNAIFADVDGDGLDDVLSTRFAVLSIYRSTPGAAAAFTLAGTLENASTVRRAGDVNGDGAMDIVVVGDEGGRLYLGCRADSTLACTGPLTTEPVWNVPGATVNLHPDLDGDGRMDAFVGQNVGIMGIHLGNAQGGISPTPVWSVTGDPAFPLFGSATPAGDLDGDGDSRDFLMGSQGRLYFFSAPRDGVSAALAPVWAWPRADRLPPAFEGYTRQSVVAPGDLNGDGFSDIIVGISPPSGLVDGPKGRVSIYGGGRVPTTPTPRPYLPESQSCGLQLDPINGKPDLGVDADVLARTLYVERRTFDANSCEVLEGCVAPGARRLLRFSSSIVNLGGAAASVPNSAERPDLYVMDVCHNHEHLTDFAGYALRDAQGNDVVKGRKQGFYLVDYHRQCSDAAPYYAYNESMGISPGWADIYVADIPCQWIDITDLTDGEYTLRVGVDEKDIIDEADVVPNEAKLQVRIAGDNVTVVP